MQLKKIIFLLIENYNFVNRATHLHYLITYLSTLNDHFDKDMFCLKFFSDILISH